MASAAILVTPPGPTTPLSALQACARATNPSNRVILAFGFIVHLRVCLPPPGPTGSFGLQGQFELGASSRRDRTVTARGDGCNGLGCAEGPRMIEFRVLGTLHLIDAAGREVKSLLTR